MYESNVAGVSCSTIISAGVLQRILAFMVVGDARERVATLLVELAKSMLAFCGGFKIANSACLLSVADEIVLRATVDRIPGIVSMLQHPGSEEKNCAAKLLQLLSCNGTFGGVCDDFGSARAAPRARNVAIWAGAVFAYAGAFLAAIFAAGAFSSLVAIIEAPAVGPCAAAISAVMKISFNCTWPSLFLLDVARVWCLPL